MSLPQEGASSLYLATQEGHLDVVKFLIQHKASVDLPRNVRPTIYQLMTEIHKVYLRIQNRGAFMGVNDRVAYSGFEVGSSNSISMASAQNIGHTN